MASTLASVRTGTSFWLRFWLRLSTIMLGVAATLMASVTAALADTPSPSPVSPSTVVPAPTANGVQQGHPGPWLLVGVGAIAVVVVTALAASRDVVRPGPGGQSR